MKTKVLVAMMMAFFAALAFGEQKALVADNHVNVRSSPAVKGSSVIERLDAGDEITVYSSRGDSMERDGTTDCWFCISDSEDKWINAEYVFTFPFVFCEQIDDGPGSRSWGWITIEDYRKEDGELYFLASYENGSFSRWEKASEHDWIGNKSINAGRFISCFTQQYDEDFIRQNLNLFEKQGNLLTLHDGKDEIRYVSKMNGAHYFLNEIYLCRRDKVYPYGIRMGMDEKEVIEKLGGYSSINQKEGWIGYRTEDSSDMTVYLKDGKVERIKLYCGM